MKQKGLYRKGEPKLGRHKKISKKALLKKVREAKKLKSSCILLKRDNYNSNIQIKSFVGKFFQSFFVNEVVCYSKHLRSNYVIKINRLFDSNMISKRSGNVESALILTFMYSESILKSVVPKSVKLIIISDSQKNSSQTRIEYASKQLLKIYPCRFFEERIVSSFHPKLFIIKFSSFIRVIIGTGNFLLDDWELYSNLFWAKDYSISSDNTCTCRPFSDYLICFLKSCMGEFFTQLKDHLSLDLNEYSIDETNVYLVASLPNKFQQQSELKFGFPRLREIIALNEPSSPLNFSNIKIYYITTSINSITSDLLISLAEALFGNRERFWDEIKNRKQTFLDTFRIIYPSTNYVNGSFAGSKVIKCLFLKSFAYNHCKFQKSVIRKFSGNSKINGNNQVVPHLKALIAIRNNHIDDDTIIYTGSHNFTKAAWGSFCKKNQTYEGFNYEVGIVMPPRKGTRLAKIDLISKLGVNLEASHYDGKDTPFFADTNDTEN